jgi:hypothetical protein
VSSPFEDPEFVAQLARMGVVHAPGMAARMMEDLAPLLAAEGIDLDNPDQDIDLDDLDEALARATEHHNLMLFTPVGTRRAEALAVLRRFAEAFAEGDEDRAAAVLAGIGSEPVADAPAISHLIGVSLGLLDAWHTDPGLRAALTGTRLPRWNRAAWAAATDVLALARKGRAFASLASLHRHGGLALLEGSVLLVAASLIARAASENATVQEVAGRVLVDGGAGRAPVRPVPPAASPQRPGASFMRTRPAPGAGRGPGTAPRMRGGMASADRALRRGFAAWLERAPSIAAPTVPEELEMLQALADIGRGHGLDLHHAPDIEALIDLLWDADDPESPEALEAALETLDDYVHFRLDAGHDLPAWEAAHEALEDALVDAGAGSGPLGAILEHAEEVDPEVRRAALARTPLIAAVAELLQWVGTGRPATQSGGVRRADIEHVAGMLGIRAVGVAKRVGSERDEDAPLQALSMAQVPLLAQWWEALATAEVIETASSRVRPGPAAAEWTAEALPPLGLAETVAAMFVAQTLTAPLGQGTLGALIVQESVLQLIRALAPEDLGPGLPDSALPGDGTVWTLRNLERVALVTSARTAGLEVTEGLRAAVARGLLAVALLAGTDDE